MVHVLTSKPIWRTHMRPCPLSVIMVVGPLTVCTPHEAAAVSARFATPQITSGVGGGSIDKVYYYRGHNYPYYYHGGYYAYRYNGQYYRHRYYQYGRWHYY